MPVQVDDVRPTVSFCEVRNVSFTHRQHAARAVKNDNDCRERNYLLKFLSRCRYWFCAASAVFAR